MNSEKTIRLSETIGGKTLTVETGLVAKQAGGAVMVRLGDTVVLSTATCATSAKPGVTFVPLTVDYRERTYAAGKIPGGFFKREGRPRDKETLASRLIDRSIRPLFPEGYNIETQALNIVLSADTDNDPDILGVVGSSAAMHISNVNWLGPVGAVRVGADAEGKMVFFPTFAERETLQLELVVSGTESGILMVEGGAREVSEETLLAAMEAAHGAIKTLCAMINKLRETSGKPKMEFKAPESPVELKHAIEADIRTKVIALLKGFPVKEVRDQGMSKIKHEAVAASAEKFPGSEGQVDAIVENVLYEESRKMVLEQGRRADGRKTDEIRQITIQAPFLPRTHGSALFTRGQTQALVTVTLGTPIDMQIMDELQGEFKERYMLHYNFPAFSTGEVKRLMGPGRREIGHGALARRALLALIPDEEKFPYTLRIVSDIMESNGSSSMASVCGGSLAMMDAGVPLPSNVAGIAMGLIKEGEKYAVISDIMGLEDHLGDMDFKVAGTRKGITAFQMDVKIGGVALSILKEAVAQAARGRIHILNIMDEALPQPRAELSQYAPRLFRVMIPIEKIGALIGPGGKNIRKIQEETGADVEVEDDGSVYISGTDAKNVESAKKMVEYVTAEAEVGKIYKGKVISCVEFGAFIEILPGKEGLCHISQLSDKRVEKVTDVVKEGDELEVKCIEVDSMGKIRLSRKAILVPGSEVDAKRPERSGGGPRGERGGRREFSRGRR